jgi:hypothetical protein
MKIHRGTKNHNEYYHQNLYLKNSFLYRFYRCGNSSLKKRLGYELSNFLLKENKLDEVSNDPIGDYHQILANSILYQHHLD